MSQRLRGTHWGAWRLFPFFMSVGVLVSCGGGGGATEGEQGKEAPVRLERGDGDAKDPQVAMAPGGDAIAVWSQSDGTRNDIWANRYGAGGEWAGAELVENGTGVAIAPQVAVDPAGNAVVVWQQYDGRRYHVWANVYRPGEGWRGAERIDTGGGYATSPQVAMDPAGNAMVVWYQAEGNRHDIWARRYEADGNWGAAVRIENDDANAWAVQVAMDASGNAVAVWQRANVGGYDIVANRYDEIRDTWGVVQLIETRDAEAMKPSVAMDPQGNAIAVWAQSEPDGAVWANRYDADSDAWGDAQALDVSASFAQDPHVAMDDDGNAMVVWEQTAGPRHDVWFCRYDAGSGTWLTSELLAHDDAGDARNPRIAMNGSGWAVAVWQQSDGTHDHIQAKRYQPASDTWSAVRRLDVDGAEGAQNPELAMDDAGNAIVVWQQFDGTRNDIWAYRWASSAP